MKPFPIALIALVGFGAIGILDGCRKAVSEPAEALSPPKTPAPEADPERDLYEKLRSTDVKVDSAINELNDALQGAQKLAPRAGGDAEKALDQVVKQLNQAGEALGDYEDSPDSYDDFKKDFKGQDDRRLRNISTVLNGLDKIGDAQNVIGDLSQNVPDAFKKDLGEISDAADEADSDLEDAVKAMGGQLPADSDEDSPETGSSESAGTQASGAPDSSGRSSDGRSTGKTPQESGKTASEG